MPNKYTFIKGERIEVVAETTEEAEQMVERGEYSEGTAETRLLIISFTADHNLYPSVR